MDTKNLEYHTLRYLSGMINLRELEQIIRQQGGNSEFQIQEIKKKAR